MVKRAILCFQGMITSLSGKLRLQLDKHDLKTTETLRHGGEHGEACIVEYAAGLFVKLIYYTNKQAACSTIPQYSLLMLFRRQTPLP